MKIPSVRSPTEFNYLINPLHKDHSKIKIVENKSLDFDSRLKCSRFFDGDY